ncbi:G-type lectin S-receptor-like serine/threonine-protein kinase [Heracleum sosnowskyi]|uniref:Receptor-like serine/threonine-protein kinase n=1 Tax=Heracleum sosnowskyi TaxID=360622 RepID=A0AAD8JHS2_9APIA|nr:G-type lectin S-receptor-like serine/threonine-protein kinase [Heracleum sosnowskyi]
MVMMSTSIFATILVIFSVLALSTAVSTITVNQSIKDGDTIISSDGTFELGFFSPGNSKNRYLGMWYRVSSSTVVWVANREIPINSTSGVLNLTASGILNLFRNTSDLTPIWSSNTSFSVQNPVAELRVNGNFVIREENDDNPVNFLWQSFDHPTDTLFSGMKLGKNFVTGQEWYLSCWKNSDDPAQGEYTYRLDPTGYPHNVIMKGQNLTFQTGAWNGLRFSGRPKSSGNTMYTHKVVISKEEVYYMFEQINSSVSRLMINQSGKGQRWTWLQQAQKWSILYEVPSDNCDNYNICGAYGDCNINNGPVCGCLEKFVPKDVDAWTKGDWGNGCTRKKPLDCQKGDGFHKYSHIKWFGDLDDMREVSDGGVDLFVRVAYSDSDRARTGATLIISLSVSGGVCLLGLPLAFCIWKMKKNLRLKRSKGILKSNSKEHSNRSQKEDLDLPYFCLSALVQATNNFSGRNKIGQGGFGPVFKGILEDGQQVAVKCLSETSRQGTNEFMNEVKFIAKLQHRNLVRLLGYCTNGENKMLIYEYMPNKSLDWHIFNEFRNKLLDWPKRFHIIDGIARGLLYLHQDSRLRIVHRDLKASNILLDIQMDSKISDFGTARSFRENETTASTNQLAGTFGYMPPEYAMDGLLSVKSDVFSFGVLALEIVCGKRNREFIHGDHLQYLSGHAWRLHREGRALELVHQNVSRESSYTLEMIRTIHIALLCVQQSREDRPDMSTVVLMLGSAGDLPMPSQPGFFTEGNIVENDASDITILQGR